jgi:hypothetical protein
MPVLNNSNKIMFSCQIAKNATGFLSILRELERTFFRKIRITTKIIREIKKAENGKIETDRNSRYLLMVTTGKLIRVDVDECEVLIYLIRAVMPRP